MGGMNDAPSRGNPGDLAAHDVLAAEEFALPASDPSIGHARVVLPDDPSGISEPHDVLAAEEFALPASPPHPGGLIVESTRGGKRPLVLIAAALGLLMLGRSVLRRRHA
jgi:hypothetical protein